MLGTFLIGSLVLIGISFYITRYLYPSTYLAYACAATIVLFIFLSGAYIVSDYFTNAGINEAVLFTLLYGLEGTGFSEYSNLIGLWLLICLAALVGFFVTVKFLKGRGRKKILKTNAILPVLATSCLALGIIAHPASTQILDVLDVKRILDPLVNSSDQSKEILENYYKFPEFTSESNTEYNIVYVYLESIDRTYFSEENFPDLVSGLKALESNSTTFTELQWVWGTGWSIAGYTASQCGIPLATSSPSGNLMGKMDLFLPGAKCIGDVLRDHGYTLEFLLGVDAVFAGSGKFHTSHGFHKVVGLQEILPKMPDKSYSRGWGVYDDTLLDIAFERFNALGQSGSKFGLFLTTMDTHHPYAQSKACGNMTYSDRQDPILDSVACSDHLVTQFITKIRESKFGKNTLIVVGSDHYGPKGDPNKRLLFFVLDPQGDNDQQIAKAGSILDVAPTVLSYMGVEAPYFGLGRDLMGNEQTLVERFGGPDPASEVLKGWRRELETLWDYPNVGHGLAINTDKHRIEIGNRVIGIPALIELTGTGKTDTIRFGSEANTLSEDVYNMDSDEIFIWVDRCHRVNSLNNETGSKGYCAFLGSLSGSQFTSFSGERHFYSLEQIRQAAINSRSNEILADRKAKLKNLSISDRVDLRENSLSYSSHPKSISSFLSVGGDGGVSKIIPENPAIEGLWLQPGTSLVGIKRNSTPRLLAHVRPCANRAGADGTMQFDEIVRDTRGTYQSFAVMVHDTAFCRPGDPPLVIGDLPLKQWARLGSSQPYIGLFRGTGKEAHEYLGKEYGAQSVKLGLSPETAHALDQPIH